MSLFQELTLLNLSSSSNQLIKAGCLMVEILPDYQLLPLQHDFSILIEMADPCDCQTQKTRNTLLNSNHW